MLYIDEKLVAAYDYLQGRIACGNSFTFALDITASKFSIRAKDLAEFYNCFN